MKCMYQGPMLIYQGAAAPCTPALCVGKLPHWKYVQVGNMSMSEIWYAYALIGNMVVGNITVEKMVIGKKSRREINRVIDSDNFLFLEK